MAKKEKSRTKYLNYNYLKIKSALDRAVTEKLRSDADETALEISVTAKLE